MDTSAFASCFALTSVEWPSSLTSIPNYTFYGCSALTSIELPEGVTSIGYRAFQGCTSLAYVGLPSTLTTIGELAFDNCKSLTDISFPSGLKTISTDAFNGCSALSGIYFNGNAPTIASDAFGSVTANAYYQIENTTWTASKKQNYGGSLTWNGLGSITGKTATLSYTSTTYTGAAMKPAVTINGLTAGSDFVVRYSNNVNAGTATATITGNGNWSGTIIKTFTINKATSSILSATLDKTSQEYTTPAVRLPNVTVKNVYGKTLVKDTDYTVVYPSSMKNPGLYTIKIVCKGNYTGTINKTFKIVPVSTSISKVTKAKKAFTVKWKKPSAANRKQMTGYQIRYSTSKDMSNAKTVTIKKTTTTSKKITNLKAKKKYYVQVRTYKTVDGTKFCSPWSAKKSVTTK